jgi:hypothetical protein
VNPSSQLLYPGKLFEGALKGSAWTEGADVYLVYDVIPGLDSAPALVFPDKRGSVKHFRWAVDALRLAAGGGVGNLELFIKHEKILSSRHHTVEHILEVAALRGSKGEYFSGGYVLYGNTLTSRCPYRELDTREHEQCSKRCR